MLILDKDIRLSLQGVLQAKHPSGRVLHELGICQGSVIVDVVLVESDLHGFEIKSASDTLHRLENQVKVYSQVLDYSSVVVAPKHVSKLVLPDHWGIYVVGEGVALETLKEPTFNTEVSARSLAELLWHGDTLNLLRTKNALKGVASRPRRFAWDRLCEVFTLEEIKTAVRAKLMNRTKSKRRRRR